MTQQPNHWKGALLGLIGGAAGTYVMGEHIKLVTRVLGSNPLARTVGDGPHALDHISLIGTHHHPDESSTAALGRIAYHTLTGQDPNDETKNVLSYLVDYAYGSLQGGVYGAFTGGSIPKNMIAGPVFGTIIWLLGDEGAVSLLGLADGPTKFPLSEHLHRWAVHIAYGTATAATTTALRRVL
ncbi:MAG TPA: hypothetical protein VFL82_05260 [Thermomicrobiales bacterium]|nr:hypothetical protein [Thermomicrobiales bacterium]